MQQSLTAGPGRVVSFHYTLTLDDGEVVDSSQGASPLEYLHGAGNIVPGLETQIAGHGAGDTFDATVPCGEAYGEYRDERVHQVSRASFPDGMELEEGMEFATEAEDGTAVPCWITAVEGDDVTVDFNHPLAGETLSFAIQVVGVREASAAELEHGHPHASGSGHECCGGHEECHGQ